MGKTIAIVLGVAALALGALYAVYRFTAAGRKPPAGAASAAQQAAATGSAAPPAARPSDKTADRINAIGGLLTAGANVYGSIWK